MRLISSLDNPLVRRALELHHKKGRIEHGQCLVEGVRATAAFFAAERQLYHLFVTQDLVGQVPQDCPDHKVVVVSERVMGKISLGSSASGILGIFVIPEQKGPTALTSGLVLAQIQDPGNMGTLIRTAVALNKKSIVIIEGVEPYNPKVIQASAGTIAFADIIELSWQELTARATSELCALVVSGGKKPQEIDFTQSLLVVGNEAHGLPEAWLTDCQQRLTLPMPGGTESLNVAVAGSIALYLAYNPQ